MLLIWGSQQYHEGPPPPTPALSIITLGFFPGSIANIVWFGFGAI